MPHFKHSQQWEHSPEVRRPPQNPTGCMKESRNNHFGHFHCVKWYHFDFLKWLLFDMLHGSSIRTLWVENSAINLMSFPYPKTTGKSNHFDIFWIQICSGGSGDGTPTPRANWINMISNLYQISCIFSSENVIKMNTKISRIVLNMGSAKVIKMIYFPDIIMTSKYYNSRSQKWLFRDSCIPTVGFLGRMLYPSATLPLLGVLGIS